MIIPRLLLHSAIGATYSAVAVEEVVSAWLSSSVSSDSSTASFSPVEVLSVVFDVVSLVLFELESIKNLLCFIIA